MNLHYRKATLYKKYGFVTMEQEMELPQDRSNLDDKLDDTSPSTNNMLIL